MSEVAPRIDAHQHYWDPARGDYSWLTPARGAIYRAFGPQDLAPDLRQCRVDGTVLVQAAASVAETDYLLAIAAREPSVLGVVGWVDFADPGHRADLERLRRDPKFRGLRPMLQDIADPQWILAPAFDRVFRALIEADLSFDALVRPLQLPAILPLAQRYPDLRIVVDHMAKPDIRGGDLAGWRADMARLAAETSVAVKLSGVATEAGPDWSTDDLLPCVSHVLDRFGAGRVMFGSDWPVCLGVTSYARWMATAEALLAGLGADARAAIFGGNAARFYRLATPGL